MHQVMLLARLLAGLLGLAWDDWACWENYQPQDGPRYACEYRQYDYGRPGGLRVVVGSDGGAAGWWMGVDAAPTFAQRRSVVLSPSAWTVVAVETGNAPVFFWLDGALYSVESLPLLDMGWPDHVRMVWLPPGEGSATFVSNGAIFLWPALFSGWPAPVTAA